MNEKKNIKVKKFILFCFNQVMMNELDRVLKLYPGSTLAEYISKNGVSKNEAQMGLNILQGAIKDSKVIKL